MKVIIKSLKKVIDRELVRFIPRSHKYTLIIDRAMKYSLAAEGKRMRPILLLLTAKACGLLQKQAMPFACAMEMIHTYSLIHDDLPAMDDDDLRRGKPASHKKFGEAVAILAGDALLNRAFEIMLSPDNAVKIGDKHRLAAACVVANASGVHGMIGGQVVDIGNQGKKLGIKKLEFLHSRKTGALITAACEAGAVLAGADKKTVEKFRLFGEKLGLVFQIVDDILDITGDEKKMGKRLRKDSAAGKNTYPGLYGIKKSMAKARKLTLEALGILSKIKGDTDGLKYIAAYFVNRTN